ncbi:MaoC/PaaZ C-terminal domain-containing protein [Nocardioides sp. L-11A]|uniref:MaoC/PaaZ C-terminal domain-containing protein n=1 Tax=Nocardioides sp. L-11A TaxID=3043848 RepID=UPI00249CF3A9|nr:MaoC/PaaZ C-terminal domain-containing protein [Nocardioides sp. L-11A]
MTTGPSGPTGPAAAARAYAEDLAPGTEYRLGRLTLTEDDIVGFATQWDPQPFHVDPAQRAHPRFTGVIASGIQSLAVLQRLCVDAVYADWQVVAGRALTEVAFLRPVRADTELTGVARVEAVTLDRPAMGLVRLGCTLTSAPGEPFLTVIAETYVARRVPSPH